MTYVTVRPAGRREGVVRQALSDLYFHSPGLVGLNVLWGFGSLGIVVVALVWSPLALLLTPVLAIPVAATFRMAARIVRQEGDRSFGGVLRSTVAEGPGTVALGAVSFLAVVVLGSNAVIGLRGTQPFEWLIGTLAAWGLILSGLAVLVALPILVDPRRRDQPVGERARISRTVLLAHPRPLIVVGVATAAFLIVSTVLVVVLFTTSLAVCALVACRTVYPLADRLDPSESGGR